MKKLICAMLGMLLIAASFSGCSNASAASTAQPSTEQPATEKTIGYQLDKPQKGETVAIMTTSMGDIKIRFFPEAAPKAVENFQTHAEKGYYNGLTFHRVMNDFMIQGGDPKGDGSGGESIWGKSFEDEFSSSLVNIRGSIAMANSGPNTNGSQFFINQAGKDSFNAEINIGNGQTANGMWEYFQLLYDAYKQSPNDFTAQSGFACVDMSKMNDAVKKLYTENGGNPTLDGAYSVTGKGHTVFAQVYDGMDVVDRIAAVRTDSVSNAPISAVTIQSIKLEQCAG